MSPAASTPAYSMTSSPPTGISASAAISTNTAYTPFSEIHVVTDEVMLARRMVAHIL
jgi:hypothetical protein